MLSKHTFLPTKSLFMAAGIAACGLATVGQSANALSVNLKTSPTPPPDYVYDISLEAGEEISSSPASTLVFTGLDGVTNASFDSGTFNVAFNSTSVTLTSTIDVDFFLPGGLDLGDLTISSAVIPGTVSWVTDTTGLGTKTATVAGPAFVPPPPPTGGGGAVPFEFSPSLGLILSGTLFGALKLRSKFSQKEEINF